MANRNFKPGAMAIEKGLVCLYGKVTLGASGAISSDDCRGFSIVKTDAETGRYTVTLEDFYNGLRSVSVSVEGSADTVYTSGAGLASYLRNVNVSTSAKTFDIQFADAAAPQADANPEDNAVLYIEIVLKNSSVSY